MSLYVLVVFLFSLICSLLSILFILFYEWRSPSARRKYRALPAVPNQSFVFGLALEMAKWKPEEYFENLQKIWKTTGDVFYFEKVGAPNVFLAAPDDIEILANSKANITKGKVYSFMTPWQGEGLATSTGEKWFTRRRMLTPTFHLDILKNFVPIFNDDAKQLTEKLTGLARKSHSESNNIDLYLHACTLDIILKTAMGLNLSSYEGKAGEYGNAVERINQIILTRFSTFWMHKDWLFNFSPTGRKFNQIVKQTHAFSDEVIRDRKKNFHSNYTPQNMTSDGNETSKKRRCFLDYLIEVQMKDPEQMTDEGIREEVDTFMAGGDYVIFLALKFILFLIAIHPDVQDKIREEMRNIFIDDSDRDASVEDIKRMNYLDMVIKESLRLYPIIPVFNRGLVTDLHLKNYTIPAGTTVWVSPYLTHRRPEIFPEPEKFDPDRFLPHAIKDRHPFAYIPFSAGYRNCIAQRFSMLELKVILSTILRKLEVRSSLAREKLEIIIGRNIKIKSEMKFSFRLIENY